MKFKKQTIKCINAAVASALATIAAMAPQAVMATPLYTTDSLITSTTPDNSGKDELAFFRDQAGNATLAPTKIEQKVTAYADGADQWYIDLGTSAAGYFLLKFGTGSTDHDSHYFFRNDGAIGTDKLVWTNAQVNFLTGGNCLSAKSAPADDGPGQGGTDGKARKKPEQTNAADPEPCGIGRLSHYSFESLSIEPPPGDNPPGDPDVPPTDVPEPGSLALAGLGLLALFGARKKLEK